MPRHPKLTSKITAPKQPTKAGRDNGRTTDKPSPPIRPPGGPPRRATRTRTHRGNSNKPLGGARPKPPRSDKKSPTGIAHCRRPAPRTCVTCPQRGIWESGGTDTSGAGSSGYDPGWAIKGPGCGYRPGQSLTPQTSPKQVYTPPGVTYGNDMDSELPVSARAQNSPASVPGNRENG